MLGARIAALRRSTGLSQAQLAEKLRISPSAMGMYEQGRREPSAETLVALSEVLEVSTGYLLTGRPTQQECSRLENILLERLDRLEAHVTSRQNPLSRQELATLFAAILLEP